MEVIVSIGPGQHDREFLSAVLQSGANVRTIRSWPELIAVAPRVSGPTRFPDSATLPVDISRGWRWASRKESVGPALCSDNQLTPLTIAGRDFL